MMGHDLRWLPLMALGAVFAFLCFRYTGQWTFANRLIIAWSRFNGLVLSGLLLVMTLPLLLRLLPTVALGSAVSVWRTGPGSSVPVVPAGVPVLIRVQRINQLDPAQYNSPAEYALWSPSTCSAASMTEVINALGGKQYRVTDILAVERSVGAITPDEGLVDNAGLVWTMQRFGFRVDEGSARSLDQVITLAQQGTPVIVNFPPAHWPGGHFLLVVGGDGASVKLVDSSSLNMQVMARSRFLYYWGGFSAVATPIAAPVAPTVPAALPGLVSSARGSSVVGGPSLSAAFVDRVLSVAGSPAAGQGQALYDLSLEYQIDDAYALAVFQHESSYGTQGAAVQTQGLGNIICTSGYSSCIGRFRSYASWAQGFEDFYRLIAHEYVAQGLSTVQTITPVYAPSSDGNDVAAYEQEVMHAMTAFRAGQVA